MASREEIAQQRELRLAWLKKNPATDAATFAQTFSLKVDAARAWLDANAVKVQPGRFSAPDAKPAPEKRTKGPGRPRKSQPEAQAEPDEGTSLESILGALEGMDEMELVTVRDAVQVVLQRSEAEVSSRLDRIRKALRGELPEPVPTPPVPSAGSRREDSLEDDGDQDEDDAPLDHPALPETEEVAGP